MLSILLYSIHRYFVVSQIYLNKTCTILFTITFIFSFSKLLIIIFNLFVCGIDSIIYFILKRKSKHNLIYCNRHQYILVTKKKKYYWIILISRYFLFCVFFLKLSLINQISEKWLWKKNEKNERYNDNIYEINSLLSNISNKLLFLNF